MALRWTAIGPALNGCHEIAPEVAAHFIALGGEDIQVWGEEYILDAKTEEAVAYAVEALSLSQLEESAE